ncbi:MAP/microtubule affinityregulating kinase [Acanthamoeba castellanii str. Neff]|uniref:non-specific serine/threonine protein kinase n=1 Tax=Acanthamoeba castellanii (strain ATCC 30010 / Neff) TaxID=1257118 RepID=L8GQL0_ACACF|nr:MAP/microtubule affinityregulating kinase [Acanthamoeba castellanii str. Neff]ELR14943.1 MAP/microtubule affinityregulating kinase [Acanthamoeba castellanii str. Neff]
METSHGPSMNGSGVRKLASPRLKARPATALSPRSSLPQHRRIQCIGHYDLDKTIGQGQFGKVKLATHVLTGERVAVKIILKSKLDEDTLKKVYREVRIMKLLNHPNIIRLYEVIETEKVLFLVMEYASGGEVLDFIVAHGRLQEREARKFFQQIVSAVDYCHKHHVIHRDIKCENLLLDADLNIKIIDFGLSNCFTPGSLMKTFCGSPTYCAPELIQRREYQGPEIDVWSLGVVLFVLVCGYLPFDAKDFQTLFRKILSGAYSVPEFVSPECRDLVRRMLVGDPVQRATLEEVLRHSWLQMGHTPASSEELADAAFAFSLSHEVDPDVVEQMESLGFPREQALDSIVNNRYDIAASTYYLLASRKFKSRPPPAPLGAAAPVAPPQPPQPQRPTRGIRGHKRHHTVDVPIAEMDNQAPSAAHQDPLRDPAPQMNKSRHPPQSGQPAAPHQPSGVPHQPTAPTPIITLTPTGRPADEPHAGAAAGVRVPDPALGNGNPGLLPFWRQRGHHRSRSVDTTSSGMQSPPQHDYTSHIIKEATILNSSPTGSRIARRSPPLNKNHSPPGHYSPAAPPHPLPPDIARVKAAARRKSMRPKSVGPWNPPAEAATIPAACDVPPPPHEDQSLEAQLRASATVQLPPPPPAPEQGPFKPGHRRAQSYDIRAIKTQEPPAAGAPWHPAQDEEDPLSDDDPSKRGDQSKNGGTLNSLVNSLKSGLGLLRGRGEKEKEKEPRSIRFALNVSTTSAKSAEEIMNEVSRVLALNNTTFTTSSYCAYCTCDDVHFEVEVCKLPMLSMNGIRFNRISGDAWNYKRIAARLIEQMEL